MELSPDEQIGALKARFYNEAEVWSMAPTRRERREAMERIDALLDGWLEITGVEVVLVEEIAP